MAGRGHKCPHCGKLTFHDNGSVRVCGRCGSVGWSWKQGVNEVGKGRGKECPNCSKQTLHHVTELESGQKVRRCGTCDFSLIEPLPNE